LAADGLACGPGGFVVGGATVAAGAVTAVVGVAVGAVVEVAGGKVAVGTACVATLPVFVGTAGRVGAIPAQAERTRTNITNTGKAIFVNIKSFLPGGSNR